MVVEHPSGVSQGGLDPGFERFVGRISDRLLRTASLLCGDRGYAEDLLQSALWRTFQHWEEVRAAPDRYAYTVVLNLARDRRRMLGRRPVEVGLEALEAPRSVARNDATLERGELVAEVARLPRRLREVVVLRFWIDLSVAETAAALGTSEGAVKAYTARGLARLRDRLREAQAANGARVEGL